MTGIPEVVEGHNTRNSHAPPDHRAGQPNGDDLHGKRREALDEGNTPNPQLVPGLGSTCIVDG